MSLGGPREEKDKSGSSCTACDVAINTVWFEDVMYDSIAFTTFVVNIAMEGTTRNLKLLSTNVFIVVYWIIYQTQPIYAYSHLNMQYRSAEPNFPLM